jgi:Sec7-like guanine-nucleotide exchange factor
MLNTDAHNPQVKVRMSKADFLRNNRGINDGSDLPEDFLSSIYEEIVSNEIRMKDEAEAAIGQAVPPQGLVNALANVGRDLQREAFIMQSVGMANRTEVSWLETCPQYYLNIEWTGPFPEPESYSKTWYLTSERAILQCIPPCSRTTHVRSRLDVFPRRHLWTNARDR